MPAVHAVGEYGDRPCGICPECLECTVCVGDNGFPRFVCARASVHLRDGDTCLDVKVRVATGELD